MAPVLFTIGGAAMSALAFSGTNLLFSQLTDHDQKKKAKDMIWYQKAAEGQKA